jgi:hypothetical protein
MIAGHAAVNHGLAAAMIAIIIMISIMWIGGCR